MISFKKICLCVLMLVCSACTLLAVEDLDEDVQPDSVVEVEFVESAPKDRFVITNVGSCVLEELTLELDLSQSAGMLIFDTSAEGPGVEVFQPFEVQEGDIVQLAGDSVDDGDAALALRIDYLGPGEKVSFTIDVDDTLPKGELGQIRVSDSEISGGIISITVMESETTIAKFDNESIARAHLPACLSLISSQQIAMQ
ncbi:MAG: aggregation factor core [Chloroflexota bacterium]